MTATKPRALSPTQAETIERMAEAALRFAREGHPTDEAIRQAVRRDWASRPTRRALAERGLLDGVDGPITVAGLEAGGSSSWELGIARENGERERAANEANREQAEREAREKWERLSHAFDGITYDDWQYVVGPQPGQDLGANVRDSLDGMSPFREGGAGVTVRVEALEQIAQRILDLRDELAEAESCLTIEDEALEQITSRGPNLNPAAMPAYEVARDALQRRRDEGK